MVRGAGRFAACAGGRAGVEQGGTNQSLLMSTPILDPSLPADNSPLSSGEMRGQFQAIQNNFDDITRAAPVQASAQKSKFYQ